MAAVLDVLQHAGHQFFGCAPSHPLCTCACCTSLLDHFKAGVRALKAELLALYYASLDEETGLLPRVLITFAVAYALSPFDLIPDFIPIVGLIDDLLLLPLLLYLARMAIPAHVLARARLRAQTEPFRLPKSVAGAVCVGASWLAAMEAAVAWAALACGMPQPGMIALMVAIGVAFAAVYTWVIVTAFRAHDTPALDAPAEGADLVTRYQAMPSSAHPIDLNEEAA
ncbi:hypothetical protein AB1Y20_004981 [Prymnesium parvum]|uniref:DUF1232 domain-containing protein n=1 Tax=Prymnesium parvum TaxID=97485 RepID=A0AB34J2V5_PRYPA